MRIAVIGAGPAGLTAALQLARGGADVDLFEAATHVGGLARSIDLWGQRVDLGPHRFFSTDARVNRFWLDIVGHDYEMIDRLTRIHYQGKFFDYPLKPVDVFRKLGIIETSLSIASYAKQCLNLRTNVDTTKSFEEWVILRFGRRLYEKFFKTYSEKLWGIPCTELSENFAAQRIRTLTLKEAIQSSLFHKSAPAHRTLADCFAYPSGGTGVVYERMAREIADRGGRVHLQQPVAKVLTEDGRVTGVQLADGQVTSCDHVISTMPLTLLVNGLSDAPESVREAASKLSFRNTILVYLEVNDANLFADQWLYVHDSDVRIGRVTNFRNWSASLHRDAGTSILCCELWCNPTDTMWKADDSTLSGHATVDLRKLGLLSEQRVLNSHVVRLPRCYPVYRIGYRSHIDVIANYLRSINGLSVIGRYGAFKYNNQDHCILVGLLAADNVLHARNHDLWDINSDFDAYQEQALITRSGLIPNRVNTVAMEPCGCSVG